MAPSRALIQPSTTITAPKRFVLKNLLCLIIGLVMGIQVTLFWFEDATPMEWRKYSSSNLTRASRDPYSNYAVEYLFNTTRVLCWIITQPENHMTRAIHIRRTWGQRCNKLIFISTQEDERLPTISMPIEEGQEQVWNKTRLALKYIYDHHLNDADWFLKAEDDTYVIMENLRWMLHSYSPDIPIYFGCKIRRHVEPDYIVGGSGLVLSKSALKKFIDEAYENCLEAYDLLQIDQDRILSNCLRNIDVIAGDSRDEHGQERFIPMPPRYVIPTFNMSWYPIEIYHQANENVSCCSPRAVSFHYFTEEDFYIFDYLLYSLRPFGIFQNSSWDLPSKFGDDEVRLKGLQDANILPTTSASLTNDSLNKETS
ncbi:glycoprotein-N-acetylgalactosamine 3-beta-galactosyltransferase 1 [Stomoxys calcitrans]|uniref:glycoprotein-N-acetylgalactosamine 3-beta-galactosyltransferase 1 n=1 Tax=Stomoxys calcitrans TaxID=35570 RepID=UPI0027E2885C|nr:glycoprotein-N-acetylgalactosamine 3-beta-galactosyltransferase 1 [Stomoxys calcitrans]